MTAGEDNAETGRLAQYSLTQQTAMWPTARAEDSESAGNHPGATDSLTGAAKLWQTPQTPKGGGTSRSGDRIDEPLLDGQARNWPTPAARDVKSGDASAATLARNARPLNEIAENFPYSLPAPATLTLGEPSLPTTPNSPRRLNPAFAEWLLGWPPGWTACDSLVTALTPWLAARRSWLCTLGCKRSSE